MTAGMYEVLVEGPVTPERARALCARHLGVPVYTDEELAALPALPERYGLFEAAPDPAAGGTLVSCSVTHARLPEWRFAARVARGTGYRCRVPDDTANPFRWLPARPDGRVRPAHLTEEEDGTVAFGVHHLCCSACAHCAAEPLCRTSRHPPDTLLVDLPGHSGG